MLCNFSTRTVAPWSVSTQPKCSGYKAELTTTDKRQMGSDKIQCKIKWNIAVYACFTSVVLQDVIYDSQKS